MLFVSKIRLLLVVILFSAVSCSKSKKEKPGGSLQEIKYDLSNEIFPNPERGFMHLYSTVSEGTPLSAVQLNSQRSANISLVHRVYYLEKFKDKPLSTAQLELIKGDLGKVRDAGLKCILRFAYTDQIDGADAPYTIIEQHLDQLKPVFEENEDIIAFVQAGLIGAWGEWHHSSNGLATPENERKVLYKLLDVLPAHLMVQVRTPVKKQEVFDSTLPVNADIAYTADKRARVGHHNDCFLSSVDDYGTYNNVDAEKNYIRNEALFVPTGGETCPPVGGFDPGCNTGKTQMALLRWTYLNLDWYKPTVDAWKTSGCFDEFQRNLGYRLALVSASLSKQAGAGQDYELNISITNKGYAPLYNQKQTSLVLKSKTGSNFYELELPADLRECKPNGTFQINTPVKLTGIPAGDYSLFLKIADRDPDLQDTPAYSVRLANNNVWTEENGGMNSLKHELKITN